jgi:hypothetical protein
MTSLAKNPRKPGGSKEGFPIREADENFCTILPSHTRGVNVLKERIFTIALDIPLLYKQTDRAA